MLGKNHKIVIKNGDCTFQTAQGRRIVNSPRASRPMARIHAAVASILSDYLGWNLGCRIEVHHGAGEFSFSVLSDPDRDRMSQPEPFELTLEKINALLTAAKIPEVESLNEVLNPDAAHLFTWMLDQVFDKKFTYELADGRMSWTPPHKKRPAGAIPPPPATPSERALAKLVAGMKK